MKKLAFVVVIAFCLPFLIGSQQALRDANKNPSLLADYNSETYRLKCSVDGYLYVLSGTGASTIVTQSDATKLKTACYIYDPDNLTVAEVLQAIADNSPNLDQSYLLGTHALLSARSSGSATIGLTAEDSTQNALHVAISDGEQIANVDSSNRLEVAVGLFPDNEPFNIAQYGGSAVGAGNALHVQPGTNAVFPVSATVANFKAAAHNYQGGEDVSATNPLYVRTAMEDAAHSSGDPGVLGLTVRTDIPTELADTDGDYAPLASSDFGALYTAAQFHHDLDGTCDATTGWTVYDSDTTGLATNANHTVGTLSLLFNKANTAANNTSASIYKVLSSVDLQALREHGGFISWHMYVSDTDDIDYAFIRLGDDASNYNEWRIDDDDITENWNNFRVSINAPSYAGNTGTGWDITDTDWISIGVEFDAETNTLNGILIDYPEISSGIRTSTDIAAQITTSVRTANINVAKIGNKNVDTDTGNADDGTQRVVIASDQTAFGIRRAVTLVRKISSQALNTSALSYTTNFAAKTRVSRIMLHAGGNITQTVTVTLDSADTANYDTILATESLITEANFLWLPEELILDSGDEILIECTAAGSPAITVYVTIVGETLL